jgi:TonB family protein
MKVRDRLGKQWRRFIRDETVPGARMLFASVVAHGLALGLLNLLVVFERSAPVVVFPGRLQAARRVPAAAVSLPVPPKRASLQLAPKQARRVARKKLELGTASTAEGEAVEALRARAKQETTALIQNFKFRMIYGFSPGPKYQLPLQTSGEIPKISPQQLPPRFEQYVIVEVTIDAEGHVADARITAGEVEPAIRQTLLAAIREFKYRPATREGIPVPSQCDIVIHIPT